MENKGHIQKAAIPAKVPLLDHRYPSHYSEKMITLQSLLYLSPIIINITKISQGQYGLSTIKGIQLELIETHQKFEFKMFLS